jgi:hypothetical protein
LLTTLLKMINPNTKKNGLGFFGVLTNMLHIIIMFKIEFKYFINYNIK